jgi:hypothetical protein
MNNLHNEDCLKALRNIEGDSLDSLVTDPPAGISFMGKAWDGDKGGRDQWIAWLTEVMKECYRVLKPGAHGLVWAIPRTSHWTATALEDAGFEIRDVVTHLFGSGFPKSMDISKAIDKAAGAEREVVGYDASKARPNKEGFAKVTSSIKTPGNAGHKDNGATVTAPATDAAKKWQGYGTALKPASEHWILIRKPLSEKTVAKNVLKHGTGGINVDGCRIGTDTISTHGGGDKLARMKTGESAGVGEYRQHVGRFPANLVLSHNDDCDTGCSEGCAVKMLDEQSGNLKSGSIEPHHVRTTSKTKNSFGERAAQKEVRKGDSGGASRFFYCAKASKSDKGADNKHPTVKSTKLMSYLIKLVTPPGGIVLDPFMGSGSTGVAALRDGFKFVGIEQDIDSFETAKRRMA